MNRSASIFVVAALLLAAVPNNVTANEFLLPISANSLRGGHGTFWTATLIVLNQGDELAVVAADRTCAIVGICPDILVVDPGDWQATGLEGLGKGNLIRVEKGDPEFSYRLYVSQSPPFEWDVLTELPIVPVGSLCNEPLSLFKIDLPAGTRHALRVYDVSAVQNPAVRVTATNIFNDVVLFDGEVQLDGRRDFHPAEATLFDFLPSPDINVLLTIRPVNPDMRIWAFLSVTDNLTQDLILYTPQTPCD